MTTSRPLPRTLKIQPAEFVDNMWAADNGSGDLVEGRKLPYPFYVYQTGRIALQRFWKGYPKQVIGFQADLAKMTIDLPWPDAWKTPEKTVGMYVVTSDVKGQWATHWTAISDAVMSEQSERSLDTDEAVVAVMDPDWHSRNEIHDRVADDGWDWQPGTTQAALNRLVKIGAVEATQPGGPGTRWQYRPVTA